MTDAPSQKQEIAPSELRSVAENTAILGVLLGTSLLMHEYVGGIWDLTAGLLVISAGMLLKAKSYSENRMRATQPVVETNSEFWGKIVTAMTSLKRPVSQKEKAQGVTISVVGD